MENQQNNAVVKVLVGHTKNLGNFEALKVAVGVELPCTEETLDETYIKASDIVTDYINAELEKYGYKKD